MCQQVIGSADWLRVPYPGQWGALTFSMTTIATLFSGTLVAYFQALGDYHANAVLSDEEPLPSATINRGIAGSGAAGGCA